MRLGEQIYKLRTKKNLSQGDLADRLDVSRQSISKWENNVTTPELDKLVKMSELFGISLDILVHGNEEKLAEKSETENVVTGMAIVEKRSKTPGIVLLGLGVFFLLLLIMLGGGWTSLFFVAPFFICGIICLVAHKHRLLLCLWGVVFVGISIPSFCYRNYLFHCFSNFQFCAFMELFAPYHRVGTAIVLFGFNSCLVVGHAERNRSTDKGKCFENRCSVSYHTTERCSALGADTVHLPKRHRLELRPPCIGFRNDRHMPCIACMGAGAVSVHFALQTGRHQS